MQWAEPCSLSELNDIAMGSCFHRFFMALVAVGFGTRTLWAALAKSKPRVSALWRRIWASSAGACPIWKFDMRRNSVRNHVAPGGLLGARMFQLLMSRVDLDNGRFGSA